MKQPPEVKIIVEEIKRIPSSYNSQAWTECAEAIIRRHHKNSMADLTDRLELIIVKMRKLIGTVDEIVRDQKESAARNGEVKK